eukprot:TRINITY_DN5350_c0_g1_i1.p1 TRINITY_DN5350_c0_g1~~TRINITY_DN5350_c0_g1_i1.p1  ORF type:complete len:202 (+),score=39.88 TRINITY_DN5350_c0_g1_i1:109-714(+)
MGTDSFLLGAAGATGPQGPAGDTAVFGIGSGGALHITANDDWTAPAYDFHATYPTLMFTTITVDAGVTLTVPSGLTLRATGAVDISGTIKVATCAQYNWDYAEGGVSRVGASSTSMNTGKGLHVAQARMVKVPLCGGGAGPQSLQQSTGGSGGGSFAIHAQGDITVSGRIEANGEASTAYDADLDCIGGGGGGGGKWHKIF